MNLILKVMKVKFPLQEKYFKVWLFTFIFILIDFSGLQIWKKYTILDFYMLIFKHCNF